MANPPPVPHRYRFEFLSQRSETPTSRTFFFSTAGSGFRYRSNQAIRLILPGVTDPWGPARTFSLSSSPTEGERIALTCKITDTAFKQALVVLEPGAPVEAVGPLGDLIYDPARAAVFVAGGIGVTPFRGMIRYALDTGATRPIELLYSARTPEEFAFRSELDRMAMAHPDLRIRYTVTRPGEGAAGWDGPTGRIGVGWLREARGRMERPKFYVVGLPVMAQEILELLRTRLGVDEADLEYEYFGGY